MVQVGTFTLLFTIPRKIPYKIPCTMPCTIRNGQKTNGSSLFEKAFQGMVTFLRNDIEAKVEEERYARSAA
jgi:hypothetical protein